MILRALKTVVSRKLDSWLPSALGRHLPDEKLLKFVPYRRGEDSFVVYKQRPEVGSNGVEGLPVPPRELWYDYGDDVDSYLESGSRDVEVMKELLREGGFRWRPGMRVLDLGCAAGRMIRWLSDWATGGEIWGCDISGDHLFWCKQNLSPPFHFFVNNLLPHLPFADGYFDLLYAGSVLTHTDDLADAWLLELRRVLARTGRIYCTVHDRHTVDLLNTTERQSRLASLVNERQDYRQYSNGPFGMFAIRRYAASQVFYDLEYLEQMLRPYLKIESVREKAYGYQTGIVLALAADQE